MAPIKPTIKYAWKFTCAHIVKQDDPTGPPSGFHFTVMPMEVSEDCVYCKEFKPTDDFTKSKAQIHKEDQQALAIYESQVETIEEYIEEAGDNDGLVKNMEKLSEECNLMWAEEVKKIERRESNTLIEPGHPASLSTALRKEFNTALSKMKLLQKAETILLERARAATYKGALTAEKLEVCCQKWSDYIENIKELKWTSLGIGSWEVVTLAEVVNFMSAK